MTIRFYPSRLPGEPLETQEHDRMTVHAWMAANVDNYRQDMAHPVAVDVDGVSVPPALWAEVVIDPGSDVRMFPVPGIIVVGIIAAVYAVYVMSTLSFGLGTAPGQGETLSMDPAKANAAKLGDPIREVLGRCRIFPDYVVQPASRFINKTTFETSLFVCLGVGEFSFSRGDIRVGTTPVTALGDDFRYTVYPPGADVSGDVRTENWFNSSEVGSTSAGGSGIDMGSSSSRNDNILADAATFSGNAVTFAGTSVGDDETNELPEGWSVGTALSIIAPDNYTVGASGLYSVITGNTLTELAAYPGMPVTLSFNGADYDLYVAAYSGPVAAVPGEGGSAASLTGSAAPSAYDFSAAAETFLLTWRGLSWPVSLQADYINMSGLVDAVATQLAGSGLVAEDASGRLSIREASSPYVGSSIAHSDLPVSVFGGAPVSVAGAASSGGVPASPASLMLAYGSATGTPFGGLPSGAVRMAVGLRDNQYRITSIDGLTVEVSRLKEGVADDTWPGFAARTVLDFSVSGINEDEKWLGPFLACPENEVTRIFEVDFAFPNGVCGFDNSGNKRIRHVEWEIQWRNYAEGSGWHSRRGVYAEKMVDGIGFTERFDLSVAGLVEVRCRRRNEQGSNNARDTMYWKGLRSRLDTRPAAYDGVTTMAITFVTGNKIAAQSDRRISVVATRNYAGGGDRSLSGAFHHVLTSAGMSPDEIDTATINALESTYWTPRGERFDFSADGDNTSVLDMMQMIANAGMGYFLLSDGLASAGREGVKPWTGIISPQETTEHMTTSFTAPSQDDYDAVDVTYINGTSWAEETVQCRIGSDTPFKVEAYQLDGVTDTDKAYRIGMRRLMKYRLQRESYEVVTEMDARCYNVGDRLVLTDDIPGSNTISCLIEALAVEGGMVTLHVSEPLDWTFASPRCLIRFQDGSASVLLTPSRVDDYTLTLPETESLRLDEWITDNPAMEMPRLIFCSSDQVGYDAIVSSVEPSSEGTTTANAVQYTPLLYQYDDAVYPGDSA
ncbi:host specificity factor TipJ family phage tail protein [Erwinia sp. Leaf53]|uniref:host specificity factor TipJ family phage tail protein n=1 Tax=Erwinia sp. Leaf53 TaxID=1736225 RepID=UPI000700EC92|nr:host specificity factor TipJ family phage tail protein [Erwinia sp. Leaf53]KQN56716.1 kinase [Erwinia sp. Leaf53]